MPGNPGYLEIGPSIEPLEVHTGAITRAEGDVHPFGNPHFTLDPIRVGKAALLVAERLGQIDTPHAAIYLVNAEKLKGRMEAKSATWTQRLEKSRIKKIITYHKTLTYFLDRFHIENPAILEPKPGIPPTSGHILEVIQIVRNQSVPLILIENYFDPTVTHRIVEQVPSVRTAIVPVAVGGAPGIKSLDDLYETLVATIEAKK